MREPNLNITSLTSKNFNRKIESQVNYNVYLLQPDYINNYNKNQELIKEKNKTKILEDQKKKNFIKTKSERFFEKYDFGVPKYYDFTQKNQSLDINKFLDEKIFNIDSIVSHENNNIKSCRRNLGSKYSTGSINYKLETADNHIRENSSIRNTIPDKNKFHYIKEKKNSLPILNQSIKSFITDNNSEREFENINHNKINSFMNSINLLNVKNDNKFNKFSYEEKNNEFNEKPNNDKKFSRNIIQENTENSDYQNDSLENSYNHDDNLNYNIFKADKKSKLSDIKNIVFPKNSTSRNDQYQNEYNPLHTKKSIEHYNGAKKKITFNLFNKDSDNYEENSFKKFINSSNPNVAHNKYPYISINNSSFYQKNEYEDILVNNKSTKKTQMGTTKENSSYNYSTEAKNKDETIMMTNKNSDTSLSRDCKITFLNKQSEREKNIIHIMTQMRCGSLIPRENKQFYLLDFNQSIGKEKNISKEVSIQPKKDNKYRLNVFPNKAERKLINNEFKKYERDFKKSLMKNMKKGDAFQTKRNFNHNFDSTKYSSALFFNSLIKYPVILNDAKNFEEILVRNTNDLLQRREILLKEKEVKKNGK